MPGTHESRLAGAAREMVSLNASRSLCVSLELFLCAYSRIAAAWLIPTAALTIWSLSRAGNVASARTVNFAAVH
jgi:type IV secretory pathway TrbD component